MRLSMRTLAVLLAIVSLAPPAWAQFDSGQISGFVRDSSKSVIPGATVVAVNEGTGDRHQTVTNASGYYVFPSLVVGRYTVTAELGGFKKALESGVWLSAATKVSVDFVMQLGALAETIEVQARSSRVQTDTAQVGRIVDSRQIQELTLNGRNPIFLALLKPGVRGAQISTFAPDSVTNGNFSINGGRDDEYVVMVDGAVATRTRSSGSMLGAQNVDTVEEVQILTANYAAEYGRSSAGQIRFVTKSGTRSFHGSVGENFRDSSLDANTWTRNHSPDPEVAKAPPALRYHDFGFTLGGPLYVPGRFNADRSKLFFFWAEEWIYRRDEATRTGTVPTEAMRRGDFSELLNPNNPFFRRVRTVNDPRTGQPFPNNVIPRELLSPNGLALLNAYPLPTPGFQQGTANWIGNHRSWSDLRKDTVRLDALLGQKHRLSLRGTHIPWHFNEPFVETFDRAQWAWSRPNKTGALSVVSTLSNTWMNEFTLSANSDGKGTIGMDPDCGTRCMRSTYGINYPLMFPGTKFYDEKIPTVTISNFTTLDGGPYPGSWGGWVYALANNTTKIAGNHAVKFGVFLEYSGQNDFIQFTTASAPATINQNGQFRFLDTGHPSSTGLGAANAAMGLFNDYTEMGAKSYTPWAAFTQDAFVQDSWKATRKLTLEAGLRWSHWQPWHSRWGNLAMFDPEFYDPAQAAVIDPRSGFVVGGDRFNGVVLPGTHVPSAEHGRVPEFRTNEFDRLRHGLPAGLSQTHHVFQPRLGVAYALNAKTAVRAGLGMFANRTMINRDTALGGNPPFQLQQTVVNGNADAPAGSTPRAFPFNITMQDLAFEIPAAWNWNLSFDRELPWSMRVEMAYVGRRAVHNQRKRNLNQLQPGTVQANPGINPNFLRPYRGYGVINLAENSGRSTYDGLQVSLERRSIAGLQFGVAYTLSRAYDDGSSLTDTLPDAYDPHSYWGLSDLDRTHVLIANYIYQLPFLNGRKTLREKLLGNWEISGVFQYQSGQPFSVRVNEDIAGVGPGSGNQFYDLVGDPHLDHGSFTDPWFNTSAFARPAAGTYGVQRRNSLRNPGFWTTDFGVRKNVPLGSAQRLQLRVEVFNLLNHPNWGNNTTSGANANPTSGSFGLVTSKYGERQIQLSLNYAF